ncbi:MAG: hypothetical protein NE328_23330 [Lentisphaeraceae bacterium]|nr:hypothetical protein [Lentisphaeraceae bacterium]
MRKVDEFRFETLGRSLWLLVFCGLITADFFIWRRLIEAGQENIYPLLFIHFLYTALFICSYLLINEKIEMYRMMICCFICCIILPFFGPLLMLAYEIFQAHKPVTPFSEPESRLYEFSRKQTGHLEDILDVIDDFTPEELDLMSLQWTDVQPLIDIVRSGELHEKCNALNSAMKDPNRDSVAMLKMALKDNSREVRYYASTALTKIESNLLDKLTDLQKEHERNPFDEKVRQELAAFYIHSCSLNIFPKVTTVHYLNSALSVIEEDEDSSAFLELKCKIHRRLENWNSIYKLLSNRELPENMYSYLCESLLRMAKFPELNDLINSLDTSKMGMRDQEVLSFWKETQHA